MAKARISYGDRLLMGSIGNLDGLTRRLPAFESYDRDKVREAISAAKALQAKLEGLLGSGNNADPKQLTQMLEQQSATRSAGQENRHAGKCD